MNDLQPLGQDFYTRARQRLQVSLSEEEVDGILVLKPANLIYLSGFSYAVNERPVGLFIPTKGEPILLVPRLEAEHALTAGIGDVRVYNEFPGVEQPVLWMVQSCGAKYLAVDTLEVPVYSEAKTRVTFLEVRDLVTPLRFIKTPEELGLIRVAASYADLCLGRILACAGGIIRRGGSELDILHDALTHTNEQLETATGPAFEHTKTTVVGTVHSGPRAALPHGRTGRRVPEQGDTLIAGIGAAVGNYHAESGATFTVGTASAAQTWCLEAAERCNDDAVAAFRVGATGAEVNDAALAALRGAGLGEAVRHRIGHGLGLEGHEAPWLAPGGDVPCAVGMVFSNEPGIYRPGLDGYRTINTMMLTETGVEIPSTFQARVPLSARVLNP